MLRSSAVPASRTVGSAGPPGVPAGGRARGVLPEGGGAGCRTLPSWPRDCLLRAMYLEQVAVFVEKLGFELVEDSSALTNDGRSKRWVVVRPPNGATALLLAQADGEAQRR